MSTIEIKTSKKQCWNDNDWVKPKWPTRRKPRINVTLSTDYNKDKAVPLQAWSGPEDSRKLRFPDFMTTAQDGGKVVSLTYRPPLPPRKRLKTSETHSSSLFLFNNTSILGSWGGVVDKALRY
jgi:hypothetical protein